MRFGPVFGQAPGAVLQRAANGARAGSQPPLVQRHQKPYRPGRVALFGGVGALPLDEPGNRFVQLQLGVGNVKAGGSGNALGEHRRGGPLAVRPALREIDHCLFGAAQVEGRALFLHRLANGLDIGVSILVQQLQKQRKVFRVAFVRRGGEQQNMVRAVPQDFAQLVALALMAFVPRRHPVRFIYDDQIPANLLQPRQNVAPLGQIQRSDYLTAFLPFVGAELVADVAAAKYKEAFVKLIVEFPLPLESEVGRADYGNALRQAAQFQLANEQAGHNSFAGAGVIGQQKPHAGQLQQVMIDRFQLMGQRVNPRHRQREIRVKLVGDAQRIGLQAQPQQPALAGVGWAGAGDG